MNRMALAQRIREVREQQHKTQEQVADAIGISRQAYNRLEKGVRDVSFLEIQAIAEFLGIAYADITDIREQSNLSLLALCRKENCAEDTMDVFTKVEEILGVFSAQERLYYRIEERQEEVRHGKI
jgi:transcriptional regulator with XRE-family HTH domain